MKQGFIGFLLLTAIAARGDFVIQEKIESADQNGIEVVKVKGDKKRTDMPTIPLGPVSVIEDLKTGDRIMMIHQRRAAKMESFAEFKQAFAINAGIEPPKVIKTGKVEKIGNYNAQIFTWTNREGAGGTFWVATNYPGAAKFQGLFTRLHQSPVGQLIRNMEPDTAALPGMVIKSRVKTSLGEVTTTVVSANEQPVAASEFQIPPNYQVFGLKVTTSPPKPPKK